MFHVPFLFIWFRVLHVVCALLDLRLLRICTCTEYVAFLNFFLRFLPHFLRASVVGGPLPPPSIYLTYYPHRIGKKHQPSATCVSHTHTRLRLSCLLTLYTAVMSLLWEWLWVPLKKARQGTDADAEAMAEPPTGRSMITLVNVVHRR